MFANCRLFTSTYNALTEPTLSLQTIIVHASLIPHIEKVTNRALGINSLTWYSAIQ